MIEVGHRYKHPKWGWAEAIKVVDKWEVHVRFDKTGFVWVSKESLLNTKFTKDLVQIAEEKRRSSPIKMKDLEGSVHKTKKWGDIEILEYLGSSKFLVRFKNTGNTKIIYKGSFPTATDHVERDRIKSQINANKDNRNRLLAFDLVKREWTQQCGTTLTITKMQNDNLLAKVSLGGVEIDKWIPFSHIKSGGLDATNLELVEGFKNKAGNLKFGIKDCEIINEIAYRKWSRLRSSCYLTNSLIKVPCYLNVTVCESWRFFSNFQTWFLENYKEGAYIDKDLMSSNDKKEYSPDSCVFISPKLNSDLAIRKNPYEKDGVAGVTLTENNTYAVRTKDATGRFIQCGTFNNIYDAHKQWQLSKAEVMQDSLDLGKYAEYETHLVESIISNLRRDAEAGVITEKLYI
jgi:hypothetical protein